MKLPPPFGKIVGVFAILATLAGGFSAIKYFVGKDVRPAWRYEVQEVRQETDAELQGLKRGQLELRSEQLDSERREYNRELIQQRIQAEEYRRAQEPVPEWLQKSIGDTEEDLREVEEEKNNIQRRILQFED